MIAKKTMMAGLLAVAGLVASQAACAQVAAREGGYAGVSLGVADIDRSVASPALIDLGTGTVDGRDTGFKLFGGYMFNSVFGAELAWMNLRGVRYSGTFQGSAVTGGEIDFNGFNLSAVGAVPMGPLVIFGKVGFLLWDAEWSDMTGGAPLSGSFDGTDVSFGVGVSLNFTRNLGLRAEWERSKLINADADFVSAGLVYRF